jgi:hypothetical protein
MFAKLFVQGNKLILSKPGNLEYVVCMAIEPSIYEIFYVLRVVEPGFVDIPSHIVA